MIYCPFWILTLNNLVLLFQLQINNYLFPKNMKKSGISEIEKHFEALSRYDELPLTNFMVIVHFFVSKTDENIRLQHTHKEIEDEFTYLIFYIKSSLLKDKSILCYRKAAEFLFELYDYDKTIGKAEEIVELKKAFEKGR